MGRSRTGQETFGEVRDGSVDPKEVQGTHGEVRDRLVDPRGGPGRVEGPSRRFGTGRGILWEVQD